MSDLQEKIAAHRFWYHRIELPGGVATPGVNPISRASYRLPEDFTGMRVLDVGAWDGYWTFEALRLGAREVVAIDDFSDRLGFLPESDRPAWATFDLCREALGYAPERCRRLELSVYDLTEEKLGRFDYIFLFGVLYHLRHPLLALDRLAAVCDERILVETAILDDYSPYRGGLGHGYPGPQMVMEFFPGDQLAQNTSNWWAPTLYCLAHLLTAAGFAEVDFWKLTDEPRTLGECRGFSHGYKRARETKPA